jgi:hypothetical protein
MKIGLYTVVGGHKLTSKEDKKWVKEQMHGVEIVKNRPDKPREEVVNKYSNKGKGILRESIFVDGKPYFLRYSEEKGFLYLEPIIQEETRTLRPPHLEECPHEPYQFTAQSLNGYYLPLAKKETIDSIYQKIKHEVKQFNDIDEYVSNLLSINVISSWFQDRLSTVHYLFIVGGNGTGKSAFGDTFECLGYRVVNVTNATEAFWYRVVGCVEHGQVTIVVEEIDKLDESSNAMNMLKVGYQPNAKVPRMNNDNDKMDFYFPFGIKILIAETSPREDKARGVLDRTFKVNSYKGYPEYKIKEVRNPQGNKRRQKILDELTELKKILLIYKLIHFTDPLVEVEVGLDGRDEELCKPYLQLFYSLGASKETMTELEQTFQHFLNTKNKRKKVSKEAILYPITASAILKHGLRMDVGLLWHEMTNSIDGELDENTKVFHSDDYGDFYRPKTIGLITDKFGAELDHKEKGNIIVFNKKIFERMGKQYDDNKGIKTVLIPDSSDSTDSSPRELIANSTDLTSIFYEGSNLDNHDIASDIDPIHSPKDGSVESVESAIQYPPNCYYCDEEFNGIGKQGYEDHVGSKHPRKPCYPGLADLELYKIKPKGMWWE